MDDTAALIAASTLVHRHAGIAEFVVQMRAYRMERKGDMAVWLQRCVLWKLSILSAGLHTNVGRRFGNEDRSYSIGF